MAKENIATTHMVPVKYTVVKCGLEEPTGGKYVGKVLPVGSYSMRQIAQLIVNEGIALSKSDVVSVLETLPIVLERALCTGYNVNMGGVCNLRLSVRGVFDDPDAPIVPGLQGAELTAQPGHQLRRAIVQKVQFERVRVQMGVPIITSYSDTMGGYSDTLYPGAIGQIRGEQLTHAPDATDEGLFFVGDAHETPTVQATIVQRVTPTKMTFMVPELIAGAVYRLELRKNYGTLNREMRVAIYSRRMRAAI